MRLALAAAVFALAACSAPPAKAPSAAPETPPLALTRVDGENWTIDRNASAITFSGTVSDAPLAGRFETFDASVRFDPAALDAAKVSVAIDTGSVRTGDKQQEAALSETEWFDGKPATFVSESFARTDSGYEMRGALTIKNATRPVTIPFSFSQSGAEANVSGSATLQRLDFDLGAASDPYGQIISKDIVVTIKLRALQK